MAIVTGSLQTAYYTAAQWTTWDGVLLAGQTGYESDTGQQKVGDGVTVWSSLPYWGGAGSVTNVSVVSANGFAGTVADPTGAAVITISTSITGLLKGNGTAISAAVAGTDYQAPITLTTTGTSGAATFIANTLNIPQYQAAGTYVNSVTASGNIASSGGVNPNITFTGVLPTANGGTGVDIASAILVTGAGITNESGASVSRIRVSANNNVAKILSWATTGLSRWAIRVEGNETGANAGGDIALRRYADDGSFIDNVFSAVRSTGVLTFEKAFKGASSLTLGTASSTAGSVVFQNASNANTVTIQSGATSASYSLTLPTAQGGASTVLTNNGSGTLSWATPSSGITVGTTTITSGTSRRIPYNSSGVYQEAAQELYFEIASPYAHVFAGVRTGVITGVNNSLFGYEAGKLLTTGYESVIIGFQAGNTLVSQYQNTIIGSSAHNGAGTDATYARQNVAIGYFSSPNTKGSQNVVIGSEAGNSEQNYNTVIGYRARFAATGTQDGNTVIGNQAGNSMNGNYNTYLGMFAGFSGTGSFSIALGYNSRVSASNTMVIGAGTSTDCISNVYYNNITSTTPQSVTINASGFSGTNGNGANLTLAGGKGTGTGAGGNNVEQTSVKGSSGTTAQSLTDRHAILGKYVDLTESSATTYGTLALATSGTIAGGVVVYTIEANDGTDYQALSGNAVYSVVNKAGTLTVTFTDLTQATALSSGTLTATMTATTSGTSVQFQANAVSSLAQTVLRISFQVLNQFGVATIAAA